MYGWALYVSPQLHLRKFFCSQKKLSMKSTPKNGHKRRLKTYSCWINLFHFRISSKHQDFMPGVSKPEFSSFGTLHSCNKKRAPEIFPVPPRGSRLDPQPGGSVVFRTLLQRNWPVLGTSGWLLGDIPIPRPPCAPWRFFGDGNNFPAGAQGLRLLFLAGFCSWEMWSCDPILFLCLLKKSWWGIFWQKHHGKG